MSSRCAQKYLGKSLLWKADRIRIFFFDFTDWYCIACSSSMFHILFLRSYASAGGIPKKVFPIFPAAPLTRKMHWSTPNCTKMPCWKANSFACFQNYFVFADILSLASKICSLPSIRGWKGNWVLWSILWGIGRIRKSFWRQLYLRYIGLCFFIDPSV